MHLLITLSCPFLHLHFFFFLWYINCIRKSNEIKMTFLWAISAERLGFFTFGSGASAVGATTVIVLQVDVVDVTTGGEL